MKNKKLTNTEKEFIEGLRKKHNINNRKNTKGKDLAREINKAREKSIIINPYYDNTTLQVIFF